MLYPWYLLLNLLLELRIRHAMSYDALSLCALTIMACRIMSHPCVIHACATGDLYILQYIHVRSTSIPYTLLNLV